MDYRREFDFSETVGDYVFTWRARIGMEVEDFEAPILYQGKFIDMTEEQKKKFGMVGDFTPGRPCVIVEPSQTKAFDYKPYVHEYEPGTDMELVNRIKSGQKK